MNDVNSQERLQLSFRPERVRLLFVGESPPAGGTYFYLANSDLYRATRSAFEQARSQWKDTDFLEAFKASGCYLTDLCKMPVNHLETPVREIARDQAVAALSKEIKTCAPEAVIVVMKGIRRQVHAAMNAAGLGATPLFALPFPGRPKHKEAFVNGLVEILKRAHLDQ